MIDVISGHFRSFIFRIFAFMELASDDAEYCRMP